MRHGKARHQKSIEQMELPLERRGEAPRAERSGEAMPATHDTERSGHEAFLPDGLMERIVARENLLRALKRVRRNKGSAGVDGRTVDELPAYLKQHWPAIREQLLTGRYQPAVVRRVELDKPGGGVRLLGIPTVLDRFIQQAVLQVLQTRLREITSRSGGRSLTHVVRQLRSYLVGWKSYFRLADTPRVLADVDKWLHRRLRMLMLKQWKRGRTMYRELQRRGVDGVALRMAARYGRSWWHVAANKALQIALPGRYFESLGVPRLGPA